MQPTYTSPAPVTTAKRLTRTVTTSGSGCVTVIFASLGIVIGIASIMSGGNLIGLILAAILIAIGVMTEPKQLFQSYCSACGNDVAATSRLCPHCHHQLLAAKAPRSAWRPILWAIFITSMALAAFFLWTCFR
jgi:hypothetical protein